MSEARRNAAKYGHGRLAMATVCVALLACVFAVGSAAESKEPGAIVIEAPTASGATVALPHATAERTGTLPATEGMTLRLTADLASVHIVTLPQGAPPAVQYQVHLETDARQPWAHGLLENYSFIAHSAPLAIQLAGTLPAAYRNNPQMGQFWVQITITVPASFNVEVNTGAGDIDLADLGGHAVLFTQGGNIHTGRIGFRSAEAPGVSRLVAKLETHGGHIVMQDINGDVDAFTAGGHIQAGAISGNAKLHSGGGHIRAAKIAGHASLETDGGNITVGQAGAPVMVRTGGGQIDFGEVHGSVRAQTGGGGIRVMYVSGPMEVESSGGSICLTRVANSVRAETGEGAITAWITPESAAGPQAVRLPGPSQLATGTGDIVVYLPRNLAVNLDVTLENGGLPRLEADPGLLMSLQTNQAKSDGAVHVTGALNGGGATLKLRTVGGKVRLHYQDTEAAVREALMREQQQRLTQRLNESAIEQIQWKATPEFPNGPGAPDAQPDARGGWFADWTTRFEITFYGGMKEDAENLKKRLVYSPPPDYPQVARRAGIQGVVRLQVRVKTDGSLAVEKVLEGEPVLAEAASAAVQQWRATPALFNDKKVDVISTVTFNFQLR